MYISFKHVYNRTNFNQDGQSIGYKQVIFEQGVEVTYMMLVVWRKAMLERMNVEVLHLDYILLLIWH